MVWFNVSLDNMKGNYFMLVCEKQEVLHKDFAIVAERLYYSDKKNMANNSKKKCGSGMIFICICSMKKEQNTKTFDFT